MKLKIVTAYILLKKALESNKLCVFLCSNIAQCNIAIILKMSHEKINPQSLYPG